MRHFAFSVVARGRGFSLLEVLVALLVISFGLLGIAGMQALSISNTSVANFRSLAALQASSIAAAMSSNEAYWSSPSVSASTSVIGSTISGTGLSSPSVVCSTSLCNGLQMAEFDLQNWGNTLQSVLPNGYGQINCASPANSPVTCQVYVYWTEKGYAQNQASTASSTGGTTYDFEMMVQP